MSTDVIDRIVLMVEQLSDEERTALLERLEQMPGAKTTRPPLDLLVFNVGAWPEGLSLSREDIYDDDRL